MKKSPLLLLISSSLVLSLSSCGTLPFDEGPPVAHRVAFNEADFASALRSGSSTLSGKIGIRETDGSMILGQVVYVDLVPVNAYTSEIVERRFIHHENLMPTGPRFDKYVRSTITDNGGNFAFHNLPAGEYFVFGVVEWQDHETYIDPDTLLDEEAVGRHQKKWAWERVRIREGQSGSIIVTQ